MRLHKTPRHGKWVANAMPPRMIHDVAECENRARKESKRLQRNRAYCYESLVDAYLPPSANAPKRIPEALNRRNMEIAVLESSLAEKRLHIEKLQAQMDKNGKENNFVKQCLDNVDYVKNNFLAEKTYKKRSTIVSGTQGIC